MKTIFKTEPITLKLLSMPSGRKLIKAVGHMWNYTMRDLSLNIISTTYINNLYPEHLRPTVAMNAFNRQKLADKYVFFLFGIWVCSAFETKHVVNDLLVNAYWIDYWALADLCKCNFECVIYYN